MPRLCDTKFAVGGQSSNLFDDSPKEDSISSGSSDMSLAWAVSRRMSSVAAVESTCIPVALTGSIGFVLPRADSTE